MKRNPRSADADGTDVAVIGAGIIGLCVAYRLVREGLRVAVLDRRGPAGGASGAATGLLPRPTRAGGPFADACLAAMGEWDTLAGELADAARADGGEPFVNRPGGLHVLTDPSAVTSARRSFAVETARGVPAEWLDADALRRDERSITPAALAAVRYPEYRHVRVAEVCSALARTVADAGGEVRCGPAGEVVAVRPDGDAWTVQTADGAVLRTACVVAATGAWAALGLPDAVPPVAIEPVRGEALSLRPAGADGAAPFRHILVRDDLHLVPQVDGIVTVGATSAAVGFDERVTAEGVAGLLTRAAELVPSLAGAELLRSWAGLRPRSRQRLPFIGPIPGRPGLFVAAGHYKSGVLLAPLTGRLIADLLLGRPPVIEPAPFGLDRPARPSAAAPVATAGSEA